MSAISSAALYGKGIFTTLAIYESKPFLWEKHWERLTENAKKIGINLSGFSEESVKNSLLEIISKNKITNARARITFFDESASGVWNFEANKKTSLLITTGDLRKIPRNFRLTISPFRVNSTSPLVGVKSCNYLENILAFDDARAKGFDEAVRLNERGEIVSACLANIFWIKNERIFTSDLETGCLKGTTRSLIIENFPVEETKTKLAKLNNAETVFLTSSGIGILKIAEIGKSKFAETSKDFDKIEKFFANSVLEN
ncbi:MAG: aminotransferase class IV [Acidobacteriota bacterium]